MLETLVSRIHAALGDDLVGIYLYGSYVSGGFDPGVSDVDLVVVTAREADQIDLAGLGRVHDDVVSLHPDWSDRLEVVYIGRAALRSFRTSTARLAVISPGEPFHLRDDRVVEWLQNWYLIREAGRTLFGPPAGTLVPPISMAEFVAAAARYADQISRQSHGRGYAWWPRLRGADDLSSAQNGRDRDAFLETGRGGLGPSANA